MSRRRMYSRASCANGSDGLDPSNVPSCGAETPESVISFSRGFPFRCFVSTTTTRRSPLLMDLTTPFSQPDILLISFETELERRENEKNAMPPPRTNDKGEILQEKFAYFIKGMIIRVPDRRTDGGTILINPPPDESPDDPKNTHQNSFTGDTVTGLGGSGLITG